MSAELEIIDLVVGEGKEAVKGALITTHYTGWLEDGTKFDSSLDRGNYFGTHYRDWETDRKSVV